MCVCFFVCDILGCDSVTGARCFPEQTVSLTEGLFVKENTGKNLSMSNGKRKKGGSKGGGGGCNRESALSRLKRPERAKMERESSERSVKRHCS